MKPEPVWTHTELISWTEENRFTLLTKQCLQNNAVWLYVVRLTFGAFGRVPPSRCAPRRPWLRSYSDTCATTLTPAATLGSIMALSWTWAAHWAKTTSRMRMSNFSSFDSIQISSLLRSCCTLTMTSQKADISCDQRLCDKKQGRAFLSPR